MPLKQSSKQSDSASVRVCQGGLLGLPEDCECAIPRRSVARAAYLVAPAAPGDNLVVVLVTSIALLISLQTTKPTPPPRWSWSSRCVNVASPRRRLLT
jgi:hypothetical protein